MRVEHPESPFLTKEKCKLAPPASPSITSATSNSSCTPFTRTTATRKRSFSRRSVRFLDEQPGAPATEVRIVERIPHEYKDSLWYNAQELADIQSRDVQENLRFQMLRWFSSASSSVLVEATMAVHNLSWRGLEHYQPAFLGGRKDTIQASNDYIQSVLHAADVIQTRHHSNYPVDPSIHSVALDSLAEFASSLSEEDRQRASLRGQQDAWTVREDEMDHQESRVHRLSYYRFDCHMISKEQQTSRLLGNHSYSNHSTTFMIKDNRRDSTRSLVLLFVLWLILLARFCFADN